MKLIIGLGNPGEKYSETRHNAGFMFLDELIKSEKLSINEDLSFSENKKFEALIVELNINGNKYVLVKPLTYMNSSGSSVQKIMQFYKLGIEDLIVISDDIDLPIGTARIRQDGSSGGQRGLQSIIDCLNGSNFTRVRIGVNSSEIDRRLFNETADFVLSKPSDEEFIKLKNNIQDVIDYIIPFLTENKLIDSKSIVSA